jgi:hypothetical protein
LKILVLTASDQQRHPLGRYLDLQCTYDFNNWVFGFNGLNHECCFFDYYKSFVENGPGQMEEDILDTVRRKNIDLVVVPNMYYEIGVSFLEKLKRLDVKSVMVFFDDSSRFESTNRLYIGSCDFVLTHDSVDAIKLYDGHAVRVEFFPCYPSYNYFQSLISAPEDHTMESPGICFVGAKIADREQYLDALTSAGIPLGIFGRGWPNGMLSQSRMAKLFAASGISLNFVKNVSNTGARQLKARAFEIVMSGGFLLTEYDEEIADYFDVGVEMDSFSSVDECIEKVRFYMANGAVAVEMGARASQKAKRLYSFESAWSKYLDAIEQATMANAK